MANNIDKLPILVERLVCFIDILGFADLINQASKKDQNAIKRIDSALRTIQTLGDRIEAHKGSRPAVHIFSDSVIISAAAEDHAVSALCKALAELTWDLLKAGVFIRGGLAVGKVSSDKTRPWGPAIVTAYRMESTVATVPRVVAHRSFLELLGENGVKSLEPLLRRDTEDGVYFIDTISYQIQEFQKDNTTILQEDLETIRDHLNVEHNKAIDNPGVYKKIDWLRGLWDQQFESHKSNLREFRTEHGKRLSLVDVLEQELNF